MKNLLFILFATLILSGCVSHPLTPEHRAQIKTVKVLPVKWESQQMVYMGREQAWGAALGAGLGAGVGMASGASRLGTAALSGAGFAGGMKLGQLAEMPTPVAILTVMDAEKIDLGALLKQGFIDALGKTSTLKVVGDDEPADAQIQLTVAEWGFRLTQGFSSVVYPTLNVVAQMNRGDEMVWRTSEAVTPFNGQNVYGYTPLTYRTDPEALRRALTGITQISSGYLVKELK
ncbi:hypothetical protein [Pseudomonas extremorientalis]|uniref:hypothetical protein n=1 Tax=Pseudomonas extremorientalis TaxID=169669 RepID=UPI00211CACC0|nr:hypothetical protein [Pseudomonas extremorientalis]UUN88963.1 hypothetical protein LUU92_00820 [Pseudomonas extremorientalis]